MFERMIFFNAAFSQFFVALASQNGFQTRFLTSFFENVDVAKILTKHWLCAEKSRFGLKKIIKETIQQRAQRRHREKLPRYVFLPPFGPPKASPKPSKTQLRRE